jgi:hypothetical protein
MASVAAGVGGGLIGLSCLVALLLLLLRKKQKNEEDEEECDEGLENDESVSRVDDGEHEEYVSEYGLSDGVVPLNDGLHDTGDLPSPTDSLDEHGMSEMDEVSEYNPDDFENVFDES